jgi:hypothetical protein
MDDPGVQVPETRGGDGFPCPAQWSDSAAGYCLEALEKLTGADVGRVLPIPD